MGATCGRLLAIDAQSGMKPRVGRPVGCSANGAQILPRKNVSKEIAFLCSSRSRHCGLGKEGGGDGWSLDGFQLTRCIDKLTLSLCWIVKVRHVPNSSSRSEPLELIKLASSKFPDYFREPIAGVAGTRVEQLLDIVNKVPNAVISEPSRHFAQALLAHTHGVISGLAT
jgi:hypothetical protein